MRKTILYRASETLVEYFHKEHHHALLLYSISIAKRLNGLSSRGEDILQDFYLKVIKSQELVEKGYEKGGLPYLLRMIRNTALNAQRSRQARLNREEICSCFRLRATGADEAMRKMGEEELLKLIESRLTEREFFIFQHYIEGYTAKEIGTLISMNDKTVGVKIHRIKKRLCKFLTQIGLSKK